MRNSNENKKIKCLNCGQKVKPVRKHRTFWMPICPNCGKRVDLVQ